jgi:opacity protein-like surface antigen
MKKSLLVLSILMVFALSASAQMPSKPFNLYAGGGLSLPMSPDGFKDGYKTGFHGYIGCGFNVMPTLQLMGKLEYHTLSADWAGYTLALGVDEEADGGTYTPLMFGVDGRWSFGVPAMPARPYVLGGLGFAHLSISDIEYEGGSMSFDSETKFYFNIGGGVDFKITPVSSLFVQARWINIATEGDATAMIPITVGMKF